MNVEENFIKKILGKEKRHSLALFNWKDDKLTKIKIFLSYFFLSLSFYVIIKTRTLKCYNIFSLLICFYLFRN